MSATALNTRGYGGSSEAAFEEAAHAAVKGRYPTSITQWVHALEEAANLVVSLLDHVVGNNGVRAARRRRHYRIDLPTSIAAAASNRPVSTSRCNYEHLLDTGLRNCSKTRNGADISA